MNALGMLKDDLVKAFPASSFSVQYAAGGIHVSNRTGGTARVIKSGGAWRVYAESGSRGSAGSDCPPYGTVWRSEGVKYVVAGLLAKFK